MTNIRDRYFQEIIHIPKFGGELWFVSKDSGDDNNIGTTPNDAFETIGAAITACSAGDAITVMAGTYTETGIDLSKNNVEMWFEIGVILNPASGDCLTISGNYCWVGCDRGALRINNDAGANTGVLITGNWAYLSEIRVTCASTGTIGYDIQGDGCDLRRCRCSSPLTAAFKVQGDKTKLENCCTGGEVADTSIGYWITNSCDKSRIKDCGSQGHSMAGFQVDTGCTNGVIENFYSGGGDGKWTDADSTTVISNLSYPETKYKGITFTTTGAQTYNLFRVYGTVLIQTINAHVTTTICDNLTLPKLETWDGTAAIEITDDDGGALTDLPVGSYIVKSGKVANGLEVFDASAASVGDQWDAKKAAFSVTAKAGVATYIRFNCTSTTTPPTGALHWHVEWEPKTDDGFLEEA